MPQDHEVFGPYWDGEKDRYADPFTVYRRLVSALQGQPNHWLREARDPDPLKRARAWEKLLPAVRHALDLVPFDPVTRQGVLEGEARQLLARFLQWVGKKKAPGSRTPTWLRCTESECFSSTPPPASACGSTSDGSGGVGPGK